jgi:hypothetical protein
MGVFGPSLPVFSLIFSLERERREIAGKGKKKEGRKKEERKKG